MPKHRVLAQMLLLTLNVALNWCKVCAVFSTASSLLHSHRRRRNRSILWSEPSFSYGSVVGTFISNTPGCLFKRPESLFYCSVPSIPWPSSASFFGNVCFDDSFLHSFMPPLTYQSRSRDSAHCSVGRCVSNIFEYPLCLTFFEV